MKKVYLLTFSRDVVTDYYSPTLTKEISWVHLVSDDKDYLRRYMGDYHIFERTVNSIMLDISLTSTQKIAKREECIKGLLDEKYLTDGKGILEDYTITECNFI